MGAERRAIGVAVEAPPQFLVMARGMGTVKPACDTKITRDAFLPNEVANPSKRAVSFFEHLAGCIAAVLF